MAEINFLVIITQICTIGRRVINNFGTQTSPLLNYLDYCVNSDLAVLVEILVEVASVGR